MTMYKNVPVLCLYSFWCVCMYVCACACVSCLFLCALREIMKLKLVLEECFHDLYIVLARMRWHILFYCDDFEYLLSRQI